MVASIWLDFERILFAEEEGWLVEIIIFLFTYFFVLFVWPNSARVPFVVAACRNVRHLSLRFWWRFESHHWNKVWVLKKIVPGQATCFWVITSTCMFMLRVVVCYFQLSTHHHWSLRVPPNATPSRKGLLTNMNPKYSLIEAIFLGGVALGGTIKFTWYQENFCDRQQRPGGFFDSWDRRTVALAFMLLLDATVGNMLLQEFSAPRNACQFL